MPSTPPSTLPFERLAFVGFGLIGGSIAMGLRAWARERAAEAGHGGRSLELRAWTPDGRGPARGRAIGLLDTAPSDPRAAIAGAQLVILAGPPLAGLQHLELLVGDWRDAAGDALVTDVASTKVVIVEAARRLGLRFVGGHPMAGREASGVEAASAALFAGRPWVVVPGDARPGDLVAVEALALALGARPLRLPADVHDAAAAIVSHLPLLAAAALVEAVAAELAEPAAGSPGAEVAAAARALVGSGWRDSTRLARGGVEMGAGIAATNAAEIAPRLRALRAAIDGWLAVLDAAATTEAATGAPAQVTADAAAMRLAAARSTLERLAPSDR